MRYVYRYHSFIILVTLRTALWNIRVRENWKKKKKKDPSPLNNINNNNKDKTAELLNNLFVHEQQKNREKKRVHSPVCTSLSVAALCCLSGSLSPGCVRSLRGLPGSSPAPERLFCIVVTCCSPRVPLLAWTSWPRLALLLRVVCPRCSRLLSFLLLPSWPLVGARLPLRSSTEITATWQLWRSPPVNTGLGSRRSGFS